MGLIVFITEVLYYSVIYKIVLKKNKLLSYILIFLITSLLFGFIDLYNQILAGFTFFILTYIILRNCILEVTNKDMIFLIFVILTKTVIEVSSIGIFYEILNLNDNIVTLIMQFAKLLLVLTSHKKLCYIYKLIEEKWNNNNFVCRHLFTSCIYNVILVCMYIIK